MVTLEMYHFYWLHRNFTQCDSGSYLHTYLSFIHLFLQLTSTELLALSGARCNLLGAERKPESSHQAVSGDKACVQRQKVTRFWWGVADQGSGTQEQRWFGDGRTGNTSAHSEQSWRTKGFASWSFKNMSLQSMRISWFKKCIMVMYHFLMWKLFTLYLQLFWKLKFFPN